MNSAFFFIVPPSSWPSRPFRLFFCCFDFQASQSVISFSICPFVMKSPLDTAIFSGSLFSLSIFHVFFLFAHLGMASFPPTCSKLWTTGIHGIVVFSPLFISTHLLACLLDELDWRYYHCLLRSPSSLELH